MTIEEIIKIIKSLPNLSAWEISRQIRKSHQRYLVLNQIESQRVVEKTKYLVTLYKESDYLGEKGLGESTVSLSLGDDPKDKLFAALDMASLVANPIFRLPLKGLPYTQVQTVDHDIKNHPIACLDQIQNDFFSESLGGIKRSSAEFFLEDNQILFLNSNGIELEHSETELMVDFVLLAEKDKSLEGESQGSKRVRFYKDLGLSEMVQQYARYARETLTAQLPKSGIYPVVVAEEALDTLFNFFCAQSSGSAQYQHWTHLTLGGPVISNLKGEPLTLISNPELKGGTKSRAFDDNGLDLHRVEVIGNNLFQKRMNNKRYADYLNEEATGNFANIEVATGKKSIKDLLAGAPCYYLLRFSTFEPNSITGAFSAEIRTGYFYDKGEVIPIKGGSVSGIMQEAFREAFYSQEFIQRSSFLGPKGVRFEQLQIVGD
jgi:PmbA protein